MSETYVRFNVEGSLVKLKDVLFVGPEVIIAEHPKLKRPVLFLRNGRAELNDIKLALRHCNLEVKRGTKTFNGIKYQELKEKTNA